MRICLIAVFLIFLMDKTGAFVPVNALKIEDTDNFYSYGYGFVSMFPDNGFLYVLLIKIVSITFLISVSYIIFLYMRG